MRRSSVRSAGGFSCSTSAISLTRSDSSNNGLDDLIVTDGTGSNTARYQASQFSSAGWATWEAEYFAAIPGINAPVHVG